MFDVVEFFKTFGVSYITDAESQSLNDLSAVITESQGRHHLDIAIEDAKLIYGSEITESTMIKHGVYSLAYASLMPTLRNQKNSIFNDVEMKEFLETQRSYKKTGQEAIRSVKPVEQKSKDGYDYNIIRLG